MFKMRHWWLALIVVIGVAALISNPAWADDDAEPKRVKKKVKIRKAADGQAGRDPMDTARRWMMKEMARHMRAMGEAEGEAAKSPLHYWFAAKDVPMAGLRDALKADGWTADELMQWMQRHFMHAMLQGLGPMMGLLEEGPSVRLRMEGPRRRRGMRVQRFGPWGRSGGGGQGGSIIIWDGDEWRSWDGRGDGRASSADEWFRAFGEGVEPPRRFRRGARRGRSGQADIQRLIDTLRQLQDGGGRPQARPQRPPMPPPPPSGLRRGGTRAPSNGSGANPKQLREMLRHLEELMKAMPQQGETREPSRQLDGLMKELLRMLEPAAKPKPKKKTAKKLESVGYRVRSRDQGDWLELWRREDYAKDR